MGHLERDGLPTEPYGDSGSASGGNAGRDWAEVSRGHSSQRLTIMGEIGCSLLLRSSRAVGVSLAKQYLGE